MSHHGNARVDNVFVFGSGSFMSENTDTVGNLADGGNVSLMNGSINETGESAATVLYNIANSSRRESAIKLS